MSDRISELERDYVTRQYHLTVIEALVAERNAAVARAERAEERIRKLAAMFGVPDGGQYLNDWKERAALVSPPAEEAE